MGVFYNFRNVELVHVGRGQARIVNVNGRAISYVNETGDDQLINLDECRCMFSALVEAGGYPPTDTSDWAAAWDALPDDKRSHTPKSLIGMRARLDDPPWFQFTNRRRTQFEFMDLEAMDALLLGPLNATDVGTGSFDCS